MVPINSVPIPRSRTVFYSGIKDKVGFIFAKGAALRININTDGSPVEIGRTHIAHGSPFLVTSSLPILDCTGGHLVYLSTSSLRLLHPVLHSFSFYSAALALANPIFPAVINQQHVQ